MERLIPVVNKLQDVFQRCGMQNPIDLPQIVVVGSQSSGKSSVLEAIVGFDFLPRGSGVVTRRPTVIQLHKLTPGEERWVEFVHCPGRRFEDVGKVRDEIVSETERVAGNNKRLTPAALIMKVFSADVVDLTLIDLPGLTKVPVGDQPPDIEKLVRAMIYSYIEKDNTIILAVHPANTDLATSDALQMARKVDPDGVRTLGVITKLDLMDEGTNALDMLQSRVIPLRRGYVGVVNRSQANLDNSESIEAARASEKTFFKNHPNYAPYAAQMGSSYLANLLSSMLMEHIRNVLPQIRAKLNSQLVDVRTQVAALGPVLAGADDSSATLLHLLTRYASTFANIIDGRPQSPITTSELAGGARISYIFHDKFGHDLSILDPFEGLGTEEIRTALRNATGHRTPLFIPESAFELLVKRQIVRFLEPSLTCVDLVYDELTRLAENVESSELARFRRLREAVADTSLKLLRERKEPTIQMVRNLIDMEMSYINTWHPDFVGGKQALTSIVQPPPPPSTTGGVSYDSMGNSIRTGSLVGGRDQRSEHPDSWVENNLLGHHQRATPGGTPNGIPEYGRGLATVNSASGGGTRMTAQSLSRTRPARWSSLIGRGVNGANGGVQGSLSVPMHLRVGSSDAVSEDERQELAILRMLLESYFNIVRKRLQDMVPKAIITFLVQRCKDSLQSVLVTKLYKPDSIQKLMVEADDTSQRRKDMFVIIALLEEALSEVNEVRDIH